MLIKGIEEEAAESIMPVLQYMDVDGTHANTNTSNTHNMEVLDSDSDGSLMMIPIDNDDETFQDAYNNAISIQENLQNKLDLFNSRLEKMHKETNWLLELPANALWDVRLYTVVCVCVYCVFIFVFIWLTVYYVI